MLDSNVEQVSINGQPKIAKKYEAELFKLQIELVKLQDWVKATNARIVISFEGRDAAGKGGMIKHILERVSPWIFRVVAPAPTERQKTQFPAQRYVEHCPPEVKSSICWLRRVRRAGRDADNAAAVRMPIRAFADRYHVVRFHIVRAYPYKRGRSSNP